MGETFMGGTKSKKSIDMLDPQQRQLFSSLLTQLGPQASETLGSFMQPMSTERMDEIFQKTYVDPAMQTYEQRTIPGIQQSFGDLNAGSSSALNQALASSAADLNTQLGSQYGQFAQFQQMLPLQAVSQFLPFLTQQNMSPVQQQQQGLAGPIIGAAGDIGAAALMAMMLSSEKAKENIRPYDKGLNELKDFEVKQYDYKEEFGGKKDKIGMIAEYLPEELTELKDGMKHVDLYGLIGLLVNSVKQLYEEVVQLKEK